MDIQIEHVGLPVKSNVGSEAPTHVRLDIDLNIRLELEPMVSTGGGVSPLPSSIMAINPAEDKITNWCAPRLEGCLLSLL